MQEGRERGKQAAPMSAQRGRIKSPPSFGFQQQKLLLVTQREESSPGVSDPGIPGCSSHSQALFLVAPFKEGFPGIAQSVTFVCFLWSALLNYFLSKKAQKFDRGDEKTGTIREDNNEELSLPWL